MYRLVEKLHSHKQFTVKKCNGNRTFNKRYSSITRDNKRSLYFLCSNCYAKQTDKNTEWNPINNAKRQKGKRLDIKQKISIIIRSITDSIFDIDYIH
jgi:hypothetical protein